MSGCCFFVKCWWLVWGGAGMGGERTSTAQVHCKEENKMMINVLMDLKKLYILHILHDGHCTTNLNQSHVLLGQAEVHRWAGEAVKKDHTAGQECTQDQAFAHGPPLLPLYARHGPAESKITLKIEKKHLHHHRFQSHHQCGMHFLHASSAHLFSLLFSSYLKAKTCTMLPL